MQSPDALRACRITQKEVLDLLLANEGERPFQRFKGIEFGRFVVAAPVADARQQCGGGVLRDVELLGRASRSRLRIPQQSVGLRQVGDDAFVDLAHRAPFDRGDREMLDVGDRLLVAAFDVGREESEQVEMQEGAHGQRFAADARQNCEVVSGDVVQHAVGRGDRVVGFRPDGVDLRAHVFVAVAQVEGLGQRRLVGFVVVVVELRDFVDESERELFAVEVGVGHRGVDAVHGVDESLFVLEHLVAVDDSRRVDVQKIAGGESRHCQQCGYADRDAFHRIRDLRSATPERRGRTDNPVRVRGGSSRC